MKLKGLRKTLCILSAFVFIMSSLTFTAMADDETTKPTTQAAAESDEQKDNAQDIQLTLEEQRKLIEQRLKESKEKLKAYNEEAKATENYIEDLDERIGYLNQELELLNNEISQAQAKVDELMKQINPLKSEIEELQSQYDEAKIEFDKLQDSFQVTYNAYCLRLRAMYISGSTNIIFALLTSDDLGQFFSRYEMIKAVAKSDTALLKEVNEKITDITTRQNGLNEKLTTLNEKKTELDLKQAECQREQEKIEKKQKEVAEKKVILSDDRAESDALLAEYTKKTQMFTEYRNEDKELVDAVNSEIDKLINGLKDPDEITTLSDKDLEGRDDNVVVGSEAGTLYSRSNAVLNMTYPAPGHYAVSQHYGHYRNGRAHTGIDFPCPTGSKIVAAQKGIVITVKRLNYSYGYYVMIYHGTDAQGRKIVTLYAHNSSILVSVGQTVTKGQQIAESGSTGNSTGPHCHFELIVDGSKINPANYLSK